LRGIITVALENGREMQALDTMDDRSVERASGKAEADEANVDGKDGHLGISVNECL